MRKRLNKSLVLFCLIAVCFVGMGQTTCRTFCRDLFGCGFFRNQCEDDARATFPPGAELKDALAACRAEYEECTEFCKTFPQEPF